MNENIISRIAEILSEAKAFAGLKFGQDIYVVPQITPVKAGGRLEIQVAEGGANYEPQPGGVRSEVFSIVVGLIVKDARTYEDRHAEVLTDQAKGIFTLRQAIIDTLNDNFVIDKGTTTELLVRPLMVIKESPVYKPKSEDMFIKEIVFQGGLNALL